MQNVGALERFVCRVRILPGLTLEAASIRSEGGCSGGGGLLPRTMPEVAVEVARRQAAEVAPQPDVPVVTACPTSKRMFERSGKTSYDLMTLLRRWVES